MHDSILFFFFDARKDISIIKFHTYVCLQRPSPIPYISFALLQNLRELTVALYYVSQPNQYNVIKTLGRLTLFWEV